MIEIFAEIHDRWMSFTKQTVETWNTACEELIEEHENKGELNHVNAIVALVDLSEVDFIDIAPLSHLKERKVK